MFGLVTSVMLLFMLSYQGCHLPAVEPEYEGVIVQKPWFFGHGGIVDEAVPPGRTWLWGTSSIEHFHIVPIKYDERYDDIMTSDNNPVTFNAFVILQIRQGESPKLFSYWGINWYENSIKEQWRASVRNKVCLFEMFEMTTNRVIADSLESIIAIELQTYLDELVASNHDVVGMPVDVNRVVIGKVYPEEAILLEINKTGVAKQRQRTLVDEGLAEEVRKVTEEKRAIADRAYMVKMGFTQSQYIRLKEIEMFEKKGASTMSVIYGLDPVIAIRPN